MGPIVLQLYEKKLQLLIPTLIGTKIAFLKAMKDRGYQPKFFTAVNLSVIQFDVTRAKLKVSTVLVCFLSVKSESLWEAVLS